VRDAVAPALEDRRAVAFAHALLLSLGAAALFLHVGRTQPPGVAVAAAALFAFHPLTLLIARNLTYYTLHIVLVTAGTLLLSRALAAAGEDRRWWWTIAAGAVWGAATLVRPLSLLLPPVVVLLARWEFGRGSWRRVARFSAVFTVVMATVIVPYAVRNRRVTGRLIPVNAQDGFAVWALTAARDPGGDNREWTKRWNSEGYAVYLRVTDNAPYRRDIFYDHAVALNEAFRAEAGRNIRRHPVRVARNVGWNLLAFHFDYTHRWLEQLAYVRDGWDWPPRVLIALALSWSILGLAVAGVVRGLRRGETDARVVAAVYGMFWVAHCSVILMHRYTYVRLPLVLAAFPLALRGIEASAARRRLLWAAAVVATLSCWELSLR
jgi:4-amino-4-deoxy-L-arabinose transferase-like glycosyltransferase